MYCLSLWGSSYIMLYIGLQTEDEDASNATAPVAEDSEAVDKPEPTHWSKLDPKSMKVISQA